MVNNNGIPIEVKKPFETVYEIKNDTPSFEEFMKSYEGGDLNYSDLSGGSVGEIKGCGPCSPSYCSGCDCSRSDCNCHSGEKFVKLYISCPADGCPGGKKTPTHWVHAKDSEYTWISNQARIRCGRSYCSTDHMKDWSFNCGDRYHNGQYLSASYTSFKEAIRMISDGEWGDNDYKTDDVMFHLHRYIRKNPW